MPPSGRRNHRSPTTARIATKGSQNLPLFIIVRSLGIPKRLNQAARTVQRTDSWTHRAGCKTVDGLREILSVNRGMAGTGHSRLRSRQMDVGNGRIGLGLQNQIRHSLEKRESNAKEEWRFKGAFELSACALLATRRQAFRLPEAASTATVSGCRSSVREMTGKRSARTQTMATASILVLCRGFRRDTIQRNRHSQMAATVIASQTRLRKVSIGSR